ncbi:hypothetical protein F8M41_024910 [Gigaspora margarita]|uniref:Uncharacterized protein n=1 Tax=Gigaspora margarita TaxID=4874 RepID=A0A8H3XK36_GIGMA|nr:hypothetical protein F8M41_024910 [Gigaspora margarita]
MRFNFTATYLIFLLAITASITVLAAPVLEDSTNDLVSEHKRSPDHDGYGHVSKCEVLVNGQISHYENYFINFLNFIV